MNPHGLIRDLRRISALNLRNFHRLLIELYQHKLVCRNRPGHLNELLKYYCCYFFAETVSTFWNVTLKISRRVR